MSFRWSPNPRTKNGRFVKRAEKITRGHGTPEKEAANHIPKTACLHLICMCLEYITFTIGLLNNISYDQDLQGISHMV